MRHIVAALVGVLGVLGCSADGSSGPTVANVAGTWSYTADNLTAGNGVTCDIIDVTMVLDQNGSAFPGTYANAEMQCLVNGVEQDQGPFNGNVVNATQRARHDPCLRVGASLSRNPSARRGVRT